jgi:hypothetical protein
MRMADQLLEVKTSFKGQHEIPTGNSFAYWVDGKNIA